MDPFEQAIHDFLQHCAHERKYSPHTVKAYRLDLRGFVAFLKQTNPVPIPEDLTCERLRDYARSRAHTKPRTIRRNIACVKSLLRYLYAEGRIAADLAADWRSGVKLGLALPRTISHPAVESIFLAVYRAPASRKRRELIRLARDRALIEILFCGGLRVAEVSDLLLTSVDLGDDVIRVNGKGSRERIVPIVSPQFRQALRRWLEIRQWHHFTVPRLFTNRMGRMRDLKMKEQCLNTLERLPGAKRQSKARSHLLAFLEAL